VNGFGGAYQAHAKAQLPVHFPDIGCPVIVQWLGGVFITEYFLRFGNILADKRIQVISVQLRPFRGGVILGL